MARQQREAHEKKEQIAQSDPLMPQVAAETAEACAVFESGEDQLVKHDGAETGQRNGQRVVMEQRDPEQRQREQDEVNGYSKH